MKRKLEFSPDQRVKLSYLLRTNKFAVIEKIKNDRLVKSTRHSIIIRDDWEYEYPDFIVHLLLLRLRKLRKSRICNFLLNRMGLKNNGKRL